MKIILATHNNHKLIEINDLFKDTDYDIVSLKDLNYFDEIIEDGKTFKENALIKAKTIYSIFHLPVISDDSGLEVEALDNAPGVYSARYSGGDDKENVKKLLLNMKDIKNRKADFNCTVCFYENDDNYHFFEGKCFGEIAYQEQGDNGFGYDPIFLYKGVSFACISMIEKNKISHRSIAFSKLKEYLVNKI